MPAIPARTLSILLCAGLLASGCAAPPERRPSRDLLPVRCLDEPDLSPCPGRRLGYYYDYRHNRCRPFVYGNCSVGVPFQEKADCEETCGADP